MEELSASRVSERQDDGPSRLAAFGFAKHTLGLILLLCVVFLWTLSNFLGSSIFADNTYAKPFFLTYLNTSAFLLAVIPWLARSVLQRYEDGTLRPTIHYFLTHKRFRKLHSEGTNNHESESFLHQSDARVDSPGLPPHAPHRERRHLGFKPTARLALTFCLLWFAANYFAMACLQYTSVASATILTSTSSIWTLLIGACTRIEKFTWRKLLGVLASVAGIVLISRVDLTAPSPEPGSSQNSSFAYLFRRKPIRPFPQKPATELALGDALALLSAMIYGVYTITLKHTTLSAAPLTLNLPLFFGLVGFFNFIFLWPLFLILHYTGLEQFQFPPAQRVWMILLINAASSLLADLCWAYAMVLTSPLVVTVGLSLTIPLSLLGEIFIQGREEGVLYWIGAVIVVGSFVFVEREEVKEEGGSGESGAPDEDALSLVSSREDSGVRDVVTAPGRNDEHSD